MPNIKGKCQGLPNPLKGNKVNLTSKHGGTGLVSPGVRDKQIGLKVRVKNGFRVLIVFDSLS